LAARFCPDGDILFELQVDLQIDQP